VRETEVENKPKLAAKNQEQQLLQRLLQLSLFANMGGKQLQILLKLSRTLALEPEESLWLEGDEPQGFYVLLNGHLAVSERGKEIGQIAPISSLGEVEMLSTMRHDDEVDSVGKCLLLEFPRDTVEDLLVKSSEICQRLSRNVVALLSLRLQKANERVSGIAHERREMEERIREAEVELNDLNMIRRMRS
jgi:CRP-like cAMP-binding protein